MPYRSVTAYPIFAPPPSSSSGRGGLELGFIIPNREYPPGIRATEVPCDHKSTPYLTYLALERRSVVQSLLVA